MDADRKPDGNSSNFCFCRDSDVSMRRSGSCRDPGVSMRRSNFCSCRDPGVSMRRSNFCSYRGWRVYEKI